MKIIENNSTFSVTSSFSLSTLDFKVLSLLYLPIIKADALAIYHSLLEEKEIMPRVYSISHDDYLSDLGIDSCVFLKARERLEAIGLLEVYRKEEDDVGGVSKVSYIYRLLPPASPKKFFSDVILKALLSQNVGKKRYFFLTGYFQVNETFRKEDYQNISASFTSVYTINNIEEDDPSLQSDEDNAFEQKSYKSQVDFSTDAFDTELAAIAVPKKSIMKEYDVIVSLATLYGINEKKTAELISSSLDSDFNFYFEKFKKEIRALNSYVRADTISKDRVNLGKSKDSVRVRAFESNTPKIYLQTRFNAEPSRFMLSEIELLKSTFNFSNGIINAILDYSLDKTNGEFNEKFIEKVAYSLSGKGVKDTYDAVQILNSREFENKRSEKKTRKKTKADTETKTNDNQEDSDDISLDSVLEAAKEFGL